MPQVECYHAFSDLQSYTVSLQDPGFIHQHVVNACAAQHTGGTTRPITVAFGLIGLYPALEKGYTGREGERAHMRIAKAGNDWLLTDPPGRCAALNVMDVLQAGNNEEKDVIIRKWMSAVWASWAGRQQWVRVITDELLQPGRA